MEPLLEISGLSVKLHNSGHCFAVLSDIHLSIYPGQVTALLGASGSGKSTLAALITGVYPKDLYSVEAGNIWWKADGQCTDLLSLPVPARMSLLGNKITQIYQEPDAALNPVLTIGSQLAEMATHADQIQNIKALLNRLGVDPAVYWNRYPWQLSGGQQQRVLLALALFPEPQVIIADEPTAALDRAHQQEFINLLKECLVNRSKPGILFITHDEQQALQLADQVVVLEEGRIDQSGLPDTILSQRLHSTVKYGGRFSDESQLNDHSRSPILQVEHLSGGYQPLKKVIHGIDFNVCPGEIVGIAGASGSGKSSILRAILGLLPWQEGTISSRGLVLDEERKHKLCKLIYQDPGRSLNPVMTIGAAFDELRAPHETKGMDRMLQVLEKVQLDQSILGKLPHMFSGGQKQRIAIAKALYSNPAVLLCDEPFSSLDAELRGELLALLKDIVRNEGIAVILVAHDLPLLFDVCDRIGLIHKGGMIAFDRPNALMISEDPEVLKFIHEG
jgi:peptide/nickel transport system ATP-binding protein